MSDTLTQAQEVAKLIRAGKPVPCSYGSADQYLVALAEELARAPKIITELLEHEGAEGFSAGLREMAQQFADRIRGKRLEGPRAALEEAERKMQSIARTVQAMVPLGWGFAVLCFTWGDDGFMNWVSNAERPDMIKALRETADKLERDPRDFHRTERPR